MTIAEMHRGVRTQFEQVAAQTLDNFLPGELDYYINRAIESYVDRQRALLLSPKEQVKSREANENLRTLIETESLTSLANLPDFGDGTVSLSLSVLGSTYAYFLKGRVKDDENQFYNARKVSLEEWHEHAPTKHNVPIFREPVIFERGDEIWLAMPNDAGDPSELILTYLRPPVDVSSELQITLTVQENSSATSDGKLHISGQEYPAPWNTNLSTTLDDFVESHANGIWTNHEVRLEREGTNKLLLTTSAFYVTASSLATTDGRVEFTISNSDGRVDSDLPETTHQDLVNHTVQILRSDLPQPAKRE